MRSSSFFHAHRWSALHVIINAPTTKRRRIFSQIQARSGSQGDIELVNANHASANAGVSLSSSDDSDSDDDAPTPVEPGNGSATKIYTNPAGKISDDDDTEKESSSKGRAPFGAPTMF
jgi:hypothetical protein